MKKFIGEWSDVLFMFSFLMIIGTLVSSAHAADLVTKASETSVKISRTVDNIVPLKQVKQDREMSIQQLERMDADYQTQRAQLVNQISAIDKIIADAQKAGVVDEVKPLVAQKG